MGRCKDCRLANRNLSYYHSVVYLVLRLLNFQIDLEKLTNVGWIDAVLELDEVIYILAFKMSTAALAL